MLPPKLNHKRENTSFQIDISLVIHMPGINMIAKSPKNLTISKRRVIRAKLRLKRATEECDDNAIAEEFGMGEEPLCRNLERRESENSCKANSYYFDEESLNSRITQNSYEINHSQMNEEMLSKLKLQVELSTKENKVIGKKSNSNEIEHNKIESKKRTMEPGQMIEFNMLRSIKY